MAKVDVQTELDVDQGWEYSLVVEHEGGQTTRHVVRLAWVDHDHWCGGRRAPSRVVAEVVERLIGHGMRESLPAKFDAAKARRWVPEIDRELREGL